ncbi:MAG TPA: bifunctional hydroxymethylpyrimidine kinase/phosphomethylpyrimidine kinase [Bryobacteraceae bacterium]|jgi:hydroxymethylpyrimidine/phosphomethylpyrimidine kinase|nr:bifunctional hydroxymethylpyrimidine kinase/phosphomethylpyrimidine kinase [Bryobacteraceae bacterium]
MRHLSVALTIAGSDPSGGAGIQADLKTFHQFGVYGEAVITLITVQNTVRVSRVEALSARLVDAQIAAVVEDIPPAAVKTGALGSAEIVEVVARAAADFAFPLIVDPVMVSSHGRELLPPMAVRALRELLLPHATLAMPNVPEAEALAGIAIHGIDDVHHAACVIRSMGPRAVLIKGGHLEDDPVDVLFDGVEYREFAAPRVATRHTHGTGCTYSAAVTASLAAGCSLVESVERAKRFIHQAILSSPGLGRGCGPVNHHAEVS